MSVKNIYFKTLKFVWLKLAIGAAITLICVLLLGICAGIAALLRSEAATLIMLTIWLLLTIGVYEFVMYYVGYMIKAAHVAIITTAVTSGHIPDNMIETGKDMVKNRFAASNAYFALDRLISGAVKQLQKVVGGIDNIFGGIPGVSTLVNFLQVFIGIALGYVDECCLGYTFYQKDEGAFKCGCDGVVIYFQNAKHLLKDAAITSLIVIVATFVAWIVPFVLIGGIFALLGWSGLAAFLLALMVSMVVKAAFIDSYMLVKMMVSYMEVAPQTEITYDLYDKLCKLSSKFREMFRKAKDENPSGALEASI
ncbi:MAG: hypothetical protein K2H52_06795 [Lachnospiraceae bacterium]|nr:hypothetical protein [Lachnospiraceae bacterium]